MRESSGPSVRVGNDPVVHSMAANDWTTCGIMYTNDPSAFFFMKSVATDDPVDCMACLVQETRGPPETIHFPRVTLAQPLHVISLEVELEPENE